MSLLRTPRCSRRLTVLGLLVPLLLSMGCGSGTSRSDQAAARTLQHAMDAASRAVDGVRKTRGSLDNLSASLQTAADETNDAVGVLTARATKGSTPLLEAGRAQRQFLQAAQRAASARRRGSALSAVAQARDAAAKAITAYREAVSSSPALAGVVPQSPAFNVGRLRDAVTAVTGRSGGSALSPKTSPSSTRPSASAPASCGAGITVNSATSCTFARNVAQAYSENGGGGTFDVYSPVTGKVYGMTCTGAMPVVCVGGNGARVEIR